MRTKRGTLVRLGLLAALSVVPLLGQGDRGEVTGIVTDASGAVVPGAQVTITQKSTNAARKVVSSSAGVFTVPALFIGAYQVKVEKEGFKTHIVDNVPVSPGGSARVDIALELGTATQSVEVSAEAQMVQTENARVATSVSSKLVAELPVIVNGGSRSPFDLAAAAAEVSGSGSNFRIGGGNNLAGMTLDGSSIAGDKIGNDAGDAAKMNSPSVEALTEFTVEASGFKAETGHASGGTLSYVSKSGTNDLHGSAFEFLRNDAMDARGFFNAAAPVLRQHNFGFTVGGPVFIPKIYNGKDKTFFFFSYEGFRQRQGAGSGRWYSVPTPEMYSGDFSKWVDGKDKLYVIYDPSTQRLENGKYVRTPFPNNKIDATQIDPIAKKYADYVAAMVKPNRTDVVMTPGTSAYVRNNYISNGTNITPSNKWSLKVDQNLGSQHHVSYLMNRYKDSLQFGPTGPLGLPDPIGGNLGSNSSQVYRGNWDYTITPTLLNRFYGGFNYWMEDFGAPSNTADAPLSAGLSGLMPAGYWKDKGMCVPGYPSCTAFPMINFTGDAFSGWGGNGPYGSERMVFEMHDDMTKISGKHTFKWGYFYGNSHYNGFGFQNGNGNLNFNWNNTSIPGAVNQATGGGSAFASFLLGQVNSYSLDTERYLTTWYRTQQMYFQDDWKVTRNFTLNLGVRYEIDFAPISGDDTLSDLSFTTPNPGAGGRLGAVVFAGNGNGRLGRRNIVDNFYGGWQPRFGFAWALNEKTTIRGAATRSYAPLTGMGQSSHNLGFAVRLINNDTSGGLTPYWILKQGAPPYPSVPNLDPSIGNGQNPPAYHDKHANIPASELNYSFNIQRQINSTSSIEIGYLSTLASDITSNFLALNQVRYRDLPANLSPFTLQGRTNLGLLWNSPQSINAGVNIPSPWTCAAGDTKCVPFTSVPGLPKTNTQALRPYPQYTTINTLDGGGDRIGHSTYHSMLIKYNKRYSSGLEVQASYTLSKMLTDADSTNSRPGDMYNLRLLKSIAANDQTHMFKVTYAYELPVGPGKKFLNRGGVVAAVVGGWRISGIHTYGSGTPMMIGGQASFSVLGDISNTPIINTYDGWYADLSQLGHAFDPNVDQMMQPQSFFPTQSYSQFGNATRYNPKFRNAWGLSEDESLARIFSFKERARLELRLEAFNTLNRVRFGAMSGATSIGNPNWGWWKSQANTARRMQIAAKISW